MSEQDISKCPVCDGELEFFFDARNGLCCKCLNCNLVGYDDYKEDKTYKIRACLDLCKNIPLQFFLNEIAISLQETNEILSSLNRRVEIKQSCTTA